MEGDEVLVFLRFTHTLSTAHFKLAFIFYLNSSMAFKRLSIIFVGKIQSRE